MFCGLAFKSISILVATQSPSLNIPNNKCSVPINSFPVFLASIKAFSIIFLLLGVNPSFSGSSIGSPVPTIISISSFMPSGITP